MISIAEPPCYVKNLPKPAVSMPCDILTHMSRFFPISLSLAACLAMPAWATTQCREQFAAGVAPTITNLKLQSRTQEICFESYAVLNSGISRTPIYSAEHLTRANVEMAKTLSRRDSFHPESSLPPQDRAELSDYSRSGFDRGHMSPNGDMANRSAQAAFMHIQSDILGAQNVRQVQHAVIDALFYVV